MYDERCFTVTNEARNLTEARPTMTFMLCFVFKQYSHLHGKLSVQLLYEYTIQRKPSIAKQLR